MSEQTTNEQVNPNTTDETAETNEGVEVFDETETRAAETTVTAYQAAKIVNALLAEEGVVDPETGEPKEIAPQMLYGYVRTGRIASVEVKNAAGKVQKRIPLNALGEWYRDYRAGNVGRSGGASTKSLVEDLKATLK